MHSRPVGKLHTINNPLFLIIRLFPQVYQQKEKINLYTEFYLVSSQVQKVIYDVNIIKSIEQFPDE
jgi:hypothetical protein